MKTQQELNEARAIAEKLENEFNDLSLNKVKEYILKLHKLLGCQ